MSEKTYKDLAARFQSLLNYLRLSAVEFSKKIGDERSEKLRRVLDGLGAPSMEMMERIKETFPSVSLDWMITGQGSMMEDVVLDGTRMAITVKTDSRTSIIPVVGASEAVKYSEHFSDPIYISSLPLLDDVRYLDAIYRDFEISSADMCSDVYPGEIVRAVWMDHYHALDAVTGFVVCVIAGRIITRQSSINGRGDLVLTPKNSLFQPVTVPKKEILELWSVVEIRRGMRA